MGRLSRTLSHTLSRTLLALAFALAFSLPVAARAQDSAPPVNSALPNWAFDQCLGGLTYGAPFKLALAYGGGFVHESPDGGADYCAFGAAKVGLGAARASIGFGRSSGPLGKGIAVSAGFMRTFGGSWGATPKRNYAGASVHVWPILGLGGEIGYYARLGDAAGAADYQRRVVTWSVGFGF